MKITIKTLSPLLSASGESTAQIDADVKYDKYGFPYIQAKTFKGLLRESALEVCEILNNPKAVIDDLFGIKGQKTSGILSFNNLNINGYGNIKSNLTILNGVLSPEIVKKHFTEIRQQTTIEDGTAKDKSLRKYRLIKEGTLFETTIENVPTINLELLKNCLINLRYIGTRRNRGFGKVEIRFDESIEISADNQPVAEKLKNDEHQSLGKLTFDVLTLDTLLIAKIFGEQNTVSTEKYIPAQNIRGLIAGLIIKSKNLSANVHQDNTFKNIILSGEIKFNNAFVKGTLPIPKIYGYDKIRPLSKAEFIFGKKEPLKPINGFAKITTTEINPITVETIFSFHTSRAENRVAGRSTEDGGAIFYYEGIAADQSFSGELIGNKSVLEYINELLQQNGGIHRMGKSKTAQYSKVKFSNFLIADFTKEELKELKSPVYIIFQSPVIVYNQFGMAVPDLMVLQTELNTFIQEITQVSIASSPDKIENYMGVWQSKTPREIAFDIGSTLKVEFEGMLNCEKLFELELAGLGERKSEGYGRVKVLDLKENLNREAENINYPNVTAYNIEDITKGEKPVATAIEIRNPFDQESILHAIFEEQVEQEQMNKLKLIAIKEASKKYGKIPNSLLSKLKDILCNTNDIDAWTAVMNEIKGKKAFKTMEDANMWDSISKLIVPAEIPSSNNFPVKKLYWIAFFNALRVKHIKPEKDDK